MKSNSSWHELLKIAQKPEHRIMGVMSGTSLDGVDLALVNFATHGKNFRFDVEFFTTVPYPSPLKKLLHEQMLEHTANVRSICSVHQDLGLFLGEVIAAQLRQWDVSPHEVDCIASHGQTIYHLPHGTRWDGAPLKSTLQIGDGDQIAVKTGIITISDFRVKDIAYGGDGAPLIPYADYILFGQREESLVLHNLGGISNLTFLPGQGKTEGILAFDTGPANVLINLAVEHCVDSTLTYDPEGKLAAEGKTSTPLLKRMLEHPFFQQHPPKSTGREAFGYAYLQDVLQWPESRKLDTRDLLATLTMLTARSIQIAYDNFLPSRNLTAYFSGGGAHNLTLMQNIQQCLPTCKILPFENLGLSTDSREAVSFALFAHELLTGRTVTFPGITGNSSLTTLGKISIP
ncbi:MAG: anhydro-N-acetylmuramic acid kinase [SAR324 cluster bacterium]|nr:anhydro-N-acetylmuramic acid kinase [SAR324 cluster bacterium]